MEINMENMVNIYLFGKKYSVPASLTIMTAMEYAGYQLKRGCGCRNGFCGACATIYRIKGKQELQVCLACQTQVEEGMYIATLPFFPLVKQIYDIEKMKDLYGGKLAFWGGVSTQQCLPYASPDGVRAEAVRIMKALRRDGGLIIAPTHALPFDVPPENILALLDVFRNQERYL